MFYIFFIWTIKDMLFEHNFSSWRKQFGFVTFRIRFSRSYFVYFFVTMLNKTSWNFQVWKNEVLFVPMNNFSATFFADERSASPSKAPFSGSWSAAFKDGSRRDCYFPGSLLKMVGSIRLALLCCYQLVLMRVLYFFLEP